MIWFDIFIIQIEKIWNTLKITHHDFINIINGGLIGNII